MKQTKKPQQTQDAKPQAPCWEFGADLSLAMRINQKPAEGPSSLSEFLRLSLACVIEAQMFYLSNTLKNN